MPDPELKTVSTVLIMSAFDKPVLQSTMSKTLYDTETSIPAHAVYIGYQYMLYTWRTGLASRHCIYGNKDPTIAADN